MTNIQTLLVVVVISLTVLLVFAGIQVILVILDLRRAVKRLNNILEDAILGGGLLRPEKLSGVIEMFRRTKNLHTHGEDQNKV